MYPSNVHETYGIFVHEQVKALVREGCRVKVISTVPATPFPLPLLKAKWRDYARIPARDRIEGIDVYYPRYLEIPGSLMLESSGLRMYRAFAKLVRALATEFPFDVIHAHVALPDGQAGVLLKREYRKPLVITVHGQDFQTTLNREERVRNSLVEVLREADRIITVSTKLKNLVRDQDFYSKITVINNGIDEQYIPDSIPRPLSVRQAASGGWKTGEERGEIRVLSVSNLKKTKGVDLTIQALATLVSRYPNLQLRVVGDGEERENLERLARELKVERHVTFLGKLPHAAVIEEMAKAEIFCLPSWQEGFGVVYIEAMAQGVPVIGVKGEGIEDAVIHQENGLLVAPQSVEEVASALDYLLADPERARMIGENGHRTVKNAFTWGHNARKTVAVYQSLCQ